MTIRRISPKQLTILVVALGLGLVIALIGFNHLPLAHNLSSPPTTIYHYSTSTIQEYFDEGQFQKAYREALGYAKDHSDNSTSSKYLGLALFQIDQYKESIKYLELALSEGDLTTSTQAQIYYFIGRDYFVLKDDNSAASYYNKSIALDPQNYQAYDGLALIEMKNKNYEKAINLFTKEISFIPNSEQNPLSAFPYYGLAKSYFYTGDYNKAKETIDMAAKLEQQLTKPKPILLEQSIHDLKLKIEEKTGN